MADTALYAAKHMGRLVRLWLATPKSPGSDNRPNPIDQTEGRRALRKAHIE